MGQPLAGFHAPINNFQPILLQTAVGKLSGSHTYKKERREGFNRRRKRWSSYEADNDKNTLYTYMELSKIFRNKTINVTNNIRKYFKTTIWENCGHLFQSATKAS